MLEKILEYESKLVSEESITVLKEFEAIEDEDWIDEKTEIMSEKIKLTNCKTLRFYTKP